MNSVTALAQIGVTVLTVAAFAFSGWGVLHVLLSAQRTARRLREDEIANQSADDELSAAQRAADTISDRDERERAKREAVRVWYQRYADRGLLAPSIEHSAREPLAERLIGEIAVGSRGDAILVGIGLVLGLAASLWSTWAL